MASPRIQNPKLNPIGIVLCVSLLSLLLPFLGDLAEKTPNSPSPLFIPGNSSANCVGDLAEKTPNSASPLFSSANCVKEGSCIGLTRSLLPEIFGKTEIYVHNVSAEGLSSGSEESPVSDTSMDNAPIHSCEECQVSAGPGSPTLQLPSKAAPFMSIIACTICGWTTMNCCGECMRFLLDETKREFNRPDQSYKSSQGLKQVPAQCRSAMCKRWFSSFHSHCIKNWLTCFYTCPACDQFNPSYM